MMAPVFSKEAWRCVWYMIQVTTINLYYWDLNHWPFLKTYYDKGHFVLDLWQNDLIHAWGLDMQLGYCAQGNRTQYIGIVDSEYVVHYGIPTLGDSSQNKVRIYTFYSVFDLTLSNLTCVEKSIRRL